MAEQALNLKETATEPALQAYVLGAVAYARKNGIYTIGLACNPDSELGAAVELAITPVVGPEVLSGSTRLKGGTATKLVPRQWPKSVAIPNTETGGARVAANR